MPSSDKVSNVRIKDAIVIFQVGYICEKTAKYPNMHALKFKN